MRCFLLLGPVLSVCFFGGCTETISKDPDIIDEFRIFAVRAEPAAIRPDETTQVEILWADPQGEGRTVWFYWSVCIVRPTNDGYVSSCNNYSRQLGTSDNGGDIYTLPAMSKAQVELWREREQRVYFHTLTCAGGTLDELGKGADPDPVDLLPRYCKNGAYLSASFSLSVVDLESPQTNPTIHRILIDKKEVLGAEDGGETVVLKNSLSRWVELEIQIPKDDQDEIVADWEILDSGLASLGGDGNRNDAGVPNRPEMVGAKWYATGGELRGGGMWSFAGGMGSLEGPQDDDVVRILRNYWRTEEAGLYTLWALARDERGGVLWKTVQVLVE